MRIAIVGAGISGLAAAALLARDGHDVTVFERAPVLASLGAGLLLSPCGMEVLERLGVLGEVEGKSTVIRSLFGTTPTGRRVLHLRYDSGGVATHGLGVHRGVLFGALRGAAESAGGTMCVGREIVGARWGSDGPGGSGGGARARRGAEGWTLELSGGATEGPFDFVIAADGARSRLRSSLADVEYAEAYPWGALWFVAADPGGEFNDQLRQVYGGTRRMIGFLPSGMVDGVRVVSMFWSLRTDTVDRVREGGVEAFKRAAWDLAGGELGRSLEGVLGQIRSIEQLIFAPYFDVLARRRKGVRGAVLGDAAHAMSPQLGQGANLGLCDAMELARCLRSGAGDVERAVAAYERARGGAWGYYARVSRMLTPWFQSDRAWLAPVRDFGMPIACAFTPTRREMLAALIGVKTGWFSSRGVPRV